MSASKKNPTKAARAERVHELQTKIYEESYMDAAIQRIALVLSKRLVDNKSNNRT